MRRVDKIHQFRMSDVGGNKIFVIYYRSSGFVGDTPIQASSKQTADTLAQEKISLI